MYRFLNRAYEFYQSLPIKQGLTVFFAYYVAAYMELTFKSFMGYFLKVEKLADVLVLFSLSYFLIFPSLAFQQIVTKYLSSIQYNRFKWRRMLFLTMNLSALSGFFLFLGYFLLSKLYFGNFFSLFRLFGLWPEGNVESSVIMTIFLFQIILKSMYSPLIGLNIARGNIFYVSLEKFVAASSRALLMGGLSTLFGIYGDLSFALLCYSISYILVLSILIYGLRKEFFERENLSEEMRKYYRESYSLREEVDEKGVRIFQDFDFLFDFNKAAAFKFITNIMYSFEVIFCKISFGLKGKEFIVISGYLGYISDLFQAFAHGLVPDLRKTISEKNSSNLKSKVYWYLRAPILLSLFLIFFGVFVSGGLNKVYYSIVGSDPLFGDESINLLIFIYLNAFLRGCVILFEAFLIVGKAYYSVFIKTIGILGYFFIPLFAKTTLGLIYFLLSLNFFIGISFLIYVQIIFSYSNRDY